ncbi:MAG: hypothetical protein NT067_05315 [Candidatus Diapherotrites archaeon]|nr:hypothetical protein [Candidatus Diapherotrites archaeon]
MVKPARPSNTQKRSEPGAWAKKNPSKAIPLQARIANIKAGARRVEERRRIFEIVSKRPGASEEEIKRAKTAMTCAKVSLAALKKRADRSGLPAGEVARAIEQGCNAGLASTIDIERFLYNLGATKKEIASQPMPRQGKKPPASKTIQAKVALFFIQNRGFVPQETIVKALNIETEEIAKSIARLSELGRLQWTYNDKKQKIYKWIPWSEAMASKAKKSGFDLARIILARRRQKDEREPTTKELLG